MPRTRCVLARLCCLAFAVGVFALTAGCQSVMSGKLIQNPDSLKGMTKTELYQTIGLPDKLSYVSGTEYLYYNGLQSKGGAVLVGNPAAVLLYFGRSEVGTVSQMLQVQDGRVVEVNSLDRRGDIHWHFWPF